VSDLSLYTTSAAPRSNGHREVGKCLVSSQHFPPNSL